MTENVTFNYMGEGRIPMGSKETPKVNIRFLFYFANKLKEMRDFYSEILGMQEAGYSEEYNYLTY